jgi:hypothetical protein
MDEPLGNGVRKRSPRNGGEYRLWNTSSKGPKDFASRSWIKTLAGPSCSRSDE